MTQPPQPMQQPPVPTGQGPSGAGGTIRFTVRGSALTNMVAPTVTINGHHVQVPTSGTAAIPAPPGRHHVEVASHWMRRYGEASIDVDVAPGQTVDVYYAAPFHQWSTGSIGTTPQKRKGTGVLVALLSVVVLLVLVVGVLPNLG